MNSKIYISEFESPVGKLLIGINDEKVCLCDWKYRSKRNVIDQRIQKTISAVYEHRDHPIASQCIDQLQEYFAQKRNSFDLPLMMIGTEFQKQVWNQLLNIPYGSTKSYLELSQQINNTKAIRALASANGANAISIIVPCHRVIGKDKSLTGYAGGIPAKRKLLELEGIKFPGEQGNLFENKKEA